MRTVIAIALLTVFQLVAQQSTPQNAASSKKAPLEVHREPLGNNVRPDSIATPSVLQQYDFGAQVRALAEGTSAISPEAVKPEFATQGASGGASTQPAVPKDFRLDADVPLNPTALEAVG